MDGTDAARSLALVPLPCPMRLLLLAALFASASASAQVDSLAAPGRSGGLSGRERVWLTAAGATASFLIAPGDDDLSLYALAAPVVAGATVYAVGRLRGHRGRLVPTLAGAAIGVFPSAALYAVSLRAPGDGFWYYLAGSAANVLVPAIGATVGFDRSFAEVRPVVIRGVDGAPAAGLALHLTL